MFSKILARLFSSAKPATAASTDSAPLPAPVVAAAESAPEPQQVILERSTSVEQPVFVSPQPVLEDRANTPPEVRSDRAFDAVSNDPESAVSQHLRERRSKVNHPESGAGPNVHFLV